MKLWNSKKIRKWLRIVHRDLGYFAVGVSMVYAISGIILNHKKDEVDRGYKTISYQGVADKKLAVSDFRTYWAVKHTEIELNRVIPNGKEYKLFLLGGMGYYSLESGEYYFEVYQKRPFVSFINKLHLNQKKSWTLIGDFSAIALALLAISGLFMVAGKSGFKKRGVWFMIAGLVLVVVFVWI